MSTLVPFVRHGEEKFVCSILEKGGGDVNEKDKHGLSSLHYASMQGHHDMVMLLLKHDADINISTAAGETPLMLAVERGHRDIVWMLCTAGANMDVHFDAGDNLVNRAAWRGFAGIVEILLEFSVDPLALCDDYNALHSASHEGWPAVVKLLVDNGVGVDSRANSLLTSLHISAMQEKTHVVSILIANGANIEARDLNGDTAIHYAIRAGNAGIVEIFLNAKARTNVANADGFTSMHLAADVYDVSVIELLCNHGVNIEMRSLMTRQTPLIYAAARGNDIVVQSLVGVGACVDAQDVTGNTALHHCIRYENPWSVRALLNANANMHITNNIGITPLHMARIAAGPYDAVEWVGVQPQMVHRKSISDTIILLENRNAENELAVAMGLHPRLGEGARIRVLDPDILRMVSRFM
jgi:ankyrin repeat protein